MRRTNCSRTHVGAARVTRRALAGAVLAVGPLLAGKKRDKAAKHAAAKIGGTVFASSGRLLPGANVTASPAEGKGKYGAVADRRGEYLIRVPPGDAVYQVTAEARGFASLTKQVNVYGEEKANANFLLDPKADE